MAESAMNLQDKIHQPLLLQLLKRKINRKNGLNGLQAVYIIAMNIALFNARG